MRTQPLMIVKLFTTALVLGATAAAYAANPPATPAKPKAVAPEHAENTVAYDELRLFIGKRVIVHTTFKTTRTGVLTQVSNTQLTLGIEAPGGTTELTMPKNTIVSVALVTATPAPQPGTPSAKKN